MLETSSYFYLKLTIYEKYLDKKKNYAKKNGAPQNGSKKLSIAAGVVFFELFHLGTNTCVLYNNVVCATFAEGSGRNHSDLCFFLKFRN